MSAKTHLINQLFELVVLLENSGEGIFSTVGLTVKTYSVLYLIDQVVNTGKALLSGSYGSRPNMTKKLGLLENGGFIERTLHPDDKRAWVFIITPVGKRALETLEPIYAGAVDQIFTNVDSEMVASTQ